MSLTAKEMQSLHEDTHPFTTDSHKQFLAQASQSVRRSEDPVETLRLLDAMWNDLREAPQQALHDVGEWLERRLLREPGVDCARLLLELGWLKRIAVARMASEGASRAGRDRRSDSRGHRPRSEGPRFGQRIEFIAQRRQALLSNSPAQQVTPLPPVRSDRGESPRPKVLPRAFQARFENVNGAREARKNAKERAKKKKEPKSVLLPVLPMDDSLGPLAAGLHCSTTRTKGFDALFDAMESHGGKMIPFWVSELEAEEGKLLVRQILLEAPRPESKELAD